MVRVDEAVALRICFNCVGHHSLDTMSEVEAKRKVRSVLDDWTREFLAGFLGGLTFLTIRGPW